VPLHLRGRPPLLTGDSRADLSGRLEAVDSLRCAARWLRRPPSAGGSGLLSSWPGASPYAR
jgi:hypothetical protein